MDFHPRIVYGLHSIQAHHMNLTTLLGPVQGMMSIRRCYRHAWWAYIEDIYRSESNPLVRLRDDPEAIICNQSGDHWLRIDVLHVVRVAVPDDDVVVRVPGVRVDVPMGIFRPTCPNGWLRRVGPECQGCILALPWGWHLHDFRSLGPVSPGYLHPFQTSDCNILLCVPTPSDTSNIPRTPSALTRVRFRSSPPSRDGPQG